jgi:hypothetical protein
MTGQAHWLTLAFVFLAALPVVYLWIVGRRADRNYLVDRCNVRCRAKGNHLVQCTLVRDAKTREPIGIRGCSADASDGPLGCGKTCLPLFAQHA